MTKNFDILFKTEERLKIKKKLSIEKNVHAIGSEVNSTAPNFNKKRRVKNSQKFK